MFDLFVQCALGNVVQEAVKDTNCKFYQSLSYINN